MKKYTKEDILALKEADRRNTKRWYVYCHFNSKGIFYFGYGFGERLYSSLNRNVDWLSQAINIKENGEIEVNYSIEIIEDGLTKYRARKLEKKLIVEYGLDSLSNRQH